MLFNVSGLIEINNLLLWLTIEIHIELRRLQCHCNLWSPNLLLNRLGLCLWFLQDVYDSIFRLHRENFWYIQNPGGISTNLQHNNDNSSESEKDIYCKITAQKKGIKVLLKNLGFKHSLCIFVLLISHIPLVANSRTVCYKKESGNKQIKTFCPIRLQTKSLALEFWQGSKLNSYAWSNLTWLLTR